MVDKVLFVDDEPAFLNAYRLMLPSQIETETAVGAEQGLAAIHDHGPYAVVVADMRMPGINGAQFLARLRHLAPETVRMMLTGCTDLNVAIEAVNHGHIFRFLTKPCAADALALAVTSGIIQYRLVTAEKDLIENTLMGSIKVLTDVLGAVCPQAFGKSLRIARCVRHLTSSFHIPNLWCFDAAAMLSQLGCIMLDPEVIQLSYLGTHLSVEHRLRFDSHPGAAEKILSNVRRLEGVAWIIAQQLRKEAPGDPPQVPEIPAPMLILGAQMLRVAVAFDQLTMRGVTIEAAVERLRYRSEFDPDLVDSLATMKSDEAKMELRRIPVSALAVGMILQQNIKNHAGVLVVARGQEVTAPLLIRLEHFSTAHLIENEITALVPT